MRINAEPAISLLFHQARGALELARGRYGDALAAFRAAGKHAELLVSPHPLHAQARALIVYTLLLAGDLASAEQAVAATDSSHSAMTQRYAKPWRRCGSHKATRGPHSRRSRRSSAVPPP